MIIMVTIVIVIVVLAFKLCLLCAVKSFAVRSKKHHLFSRMFCSLSVYLLGGDVGSSSFL